MLDTFRALSKINVKKELKSPIVRYYRTYSKLSKYRFLPTSISKLVLLKSRIFTDE